MNPPQISRSNPYICFPQYSRAGPSFTVVRVMPELSVIVLESMAYPLAGRPLYQWDYSCTSVYGDMPAYFEDAYAL